MRIFLHYVRAHRKYIIIALLFVCIFAAVFTLYDLPVEAVGYAATLCTVAGLLFFIHGYIRFRKKHNLLQEMQNRIAINLNDLPAPSTLLEKDYNSLIELLHQHIHSIDAQHASQRQDMLDYYTMWAHQIKTPIAAMQLLLQTESSDKNSELLEQLFKIEQYVSMVLQYLRIESFSSDLVIRDCPLDGIVKQAVRKYAKSFIRKKITLDFTELGCQVLTDEKWLVFVIEQLISNALKYTHKGKIAIYMDSAAPKTLVIADTGMGIQKEDLPRVFEKGFTGYNGRTDKKSTGIGLYLCKKIVSKLSHTISIESEVGKGTRVKLNLDSVKKVTE